MKLLIADDEPLARRRLCDLIQELGGHEILAQASDGRETCELVATLHPEAVILDIAMPVMDGLEAARHLARLPQPPAVVFCTAYDEHALAAFDAHAVDYLVKPIRIERLAQALDRAQRMRLEPITLPTAGARRSHLSARMRGSLRLIPLREVRYLQADEKYVVVHHAHGEDLIDDSLKSLEAEFGDQFIRVHRNCLVATDEIRELTRDNEGQEVVALRHTSALLEVSRRCLPNVRQRLKSL
ncbi:MAG: response regulator transcription factor [Xanthomonadales bacterium]|nr:response regulator transcription factor [Xanthomonadales bacterium]